jgi:hypothetical protein
VPARPRLAYDTGCACLGASSSRCVHHTSSLVDNILRTRLAIKLGVETIRRDCAVLRAPPSDMLCT